MGSIQIRLIKNYEEFLDVLKIREKVFIKGQEVPRDIEIDGLDEAADHVIVLFNKKPVGCARLRFIDKKAKLERIAILEGFRRKGIGKKLTEFLIEYCKKQGVDQIVIHAQYYLYDFYRAFGFRPFGRKFTEAGIKHIEMRLIVG